MARAPALCWSARHGRNRAHPAPIRAVVPADEQRQDDKALHRLRQVAADQRAEPVGLSVEAEADALNLLEVLEFDLKQPHQFDGHARDPRNADIAIIMVTTQNHPADIQRASSAGVDDYIVKPFDPDVLISTLHQVISDRAIG